ncbi:MAG: glycosyltransferase family 4 protein [Bacteroidetes bacterium]|nr:glycosyltransferase family 4 protein [Fibrella sp.]
MTKILIDTERLRDLNSGLGQFCLNLGRELVRQKPEADELTFLTPTGQAEVFGNTVQYRPTVWWDKLWRSDEFSIWHATHQDAAYWPSSYTKLILTIHDLNFLDRPDYSEAKKQRKLTAVQRTIDQASAITTISEYTASVLRDRLTLPDVPLKIIYNGVSKLESSVLVDDLIKIAIASSPFFLYLGVVHPKKNVHTLLPLLQAFPDYKLVMAGDDAHEYAQHVHHQAVKLGVADQLIMTGAVYEATKTWLYERCEAFLFPSLTEGFGLPVVEAMSLGKPVFLSNLTSLPEIGGRDAVYFNTFEPDDMVETLRLGMQDFYDDPLKADRLRWRANRFSWERAAQAYWTLYQEVAAKR